MTSRRIVCFAAVVTLMAGILRGQDKKDVPPIAKVVPANWGKLGLSDQQKQAVYTIQAECHEKVSALEKQIRMLKSQEKADMEAVLNEDQKKLLREILLKKAGADDKQDEKK